MRFRKRIWTDLRQRIAATRWPSRELVDDRSQGVQLATTQALASFWETEYDWRSVEAKLNALPQFKTEIDGVEIHFIHVRSQHEDALPLIMTHGWPGSVVELLETVGPLTDPTAHGGDAADAFHLVLPSLPGYGFSAEPTELGWDSAPDGRAWAELMRRLGYDRYVAQGGDVGALVTDLMGRQGVEGLAGIHVNLLDRGARDRRSLPKESDRNGRGRGVRDVQGGRLRLLPRDGDAAADDRLRHARFTGRAGGLDARPRHGQLLQDRGAFVDGSPRATSRGSSIVDNITLYWLTGTGASAARSYWEDGRALAASLASGQPPPPVNGAGRLHHVPRRDLGVAAELGRGGLPRPRLLQRGRQGRPLRRLGGAGGVHRRGSLGVPDAALGSVFGRLHPRVHMPSLDGATGWLNSEPLDPAGLRGRVVLVNFWTLTCINWLRQEPYVRAWSQAYRDDGLVVIGVHTPEFSFEHDVDLVRRAMRSGRSTIRSLSTTTTGSGARSTTTTGRRSTSSTPRGSSATSTSAKGGTSESEREIQRLLGVERELVAVEGIGVEAEADWDHLRTPETYLGYGRGERFASPAAPPRRTRAYELPERLRLNHWALDGEWTIGRENVVLDEAGGSIAFRFHARDAHLVLSHGAASRFPSACSSTARRPAPSHGVDVDEDGNGLLRDGRLYQLVRQHDDIRERTLEITFLEPGAEAYSFTFG